MYARTYSRSRIHALTLELDNAYNLKKICSTKDISLILPSYVYELDNNYIYRYAYTPAAHARSLARSHARRYTHCYFEYINYI